MKITRRQKFEEYIRLMSKVGIERFPKDSHEREIIDEAILLMKDMMKGYPVFDDTRETQSDAIKKKCEEFVSTMSELGVGVTLIVRGNE